MPNADIDAFYCSAFYAIMLCFIEYSHSGPIALAPRKNFRFLLYIVLLQKQFVSVEDVVVADEESVSASAASIASITHISLCDKSPSDMNTIITISKNKNQLSPNILHLFDFLPQYAPRYAKVTRFFHS